MLGSSPKHKEKEQETWTIFPGANCQYLASGRTRRADDPSTLCLLTASSERETHLRERLIEMTQYPLLVKLPLALNQINWGE